MTGKTKMTTDPRQRSLEFGQKVHIDCRDCGMSYDRRVASDRNDHAKYHLQKTHGVEWPDIAGPLATGVAASASIRLDPQTSAEGRLLRTHRLPASIVKSYCESARSILQSAGKPHSNTISSFSTDKRLVQILTFDTKGPNMRLYSRAVLNALSLAESEQDEALGAIPMYTFQRAYTSTAVHEPGSARFLVAVYQRRIVGSLFVDSVQPGTASYAKYDPFHGYEEGEPVPARNTPKLGVWRIHVVSGLRRGHVATALLDAALDDCIYGMRAQDIVARYGNGRYANVVAFNQPTQQGGAFAEAWLRRHDGLTKAQHSGLILCVA